MPLSARVLLAPTLLALAACGGGGGGGGSSSSSSSSGGGSGPPPTVTFFSNAAFIGTGQSPTLQWSSTAGSTCTASGGWSGGKSSAGSQIVGPVTQTTTFTLSCTGTNSSASTASVTVVAGSALPPAPTASKVTSEENLTSLDFARLPYRVRAMAWSEATGRLYAVTALDSQTAPNSLLAIDPTTLAVQTLPLDGPALRMAVTDNGEFVYVGHSYHVNYTANGIRRVRTSDLTVDLSIPVGTATTSVQRIALAPGSAHTFAVVANRLSNPDHGDYGLVIYDDAVPRPKYAGPITILPPVPPEVSITVIDADWNTDGSTIYATGYSHSSGLYYLDVAADGVSLNRHRNWPMASPGTIVGDRFFSTDGRVFNMNGPVNLASRIPDWYFASPGRHPVPARGKVFSVGTNLDGAFEDGTRIIASDIDSYTYIDAVAFNGPAHFRPGSLEPWGTDGLAIGGENELVIAHGTFAAAGGVPPPSSATLPIVAAGMARNAAGDVINFRVAHVLAWSAVTNPCGKLYVGTSSESWVRGGSVLEVDPDTMTIVRSTRVDADPLMLAASDDCSTLYVGQRSSSSVLRLRTSDLTITDVLPLGGEQLSRARSMSVAPGQPQTVAIAMGDIERTLCAGSDDGVVIYDGITPRPVYQPNLSVDKIKSVAFGANSNTLYGKSIFNVQAFDVGAGGLGNPRTLMTDLGNAWHYDLGRDLHYDPAANRVYNKFGNVFDVTTNTELPRISLAHAAATDGCGTPLQGAITDRTTGKLFWIGNSRQYHLGISAHARNGLASLGAVDIGLGQDFGELGGPHDLSRLSGNRVAFVTNRGYLVVLEGPLLAP